ncbi:MAG TPA: hypothetical protein VGL81_04425 [Polyangiaceae bacterium]
MTTKNAKKDGARARQAEHGGKYEGHLRTVGGGTSRTKPWTCEVCKQPIEGKKGYVVIMDRVTRNHPTDPTPTDMQLTDEAIAERRRNGEPTEPPFESVRMGEIKLPLDRNLFEAYHRDCDPDPDTNPYWISADEADSLEAWCAWMEHLCEKNWMGVPDLRNMIAFWFENRGDDLHAYA